MGGALSAVLIRTLSVAKWIGRYHTHSMSLQRELQTLNLYNIRLLDIATLQNIFLPLILRLGLFFFSFPALNKHKARGWLQIRNPVDTSASSFPQKMLRHRVWCHSFTVSRAFTILYHSHWHSRRLGQREKSTSISFTTSLSVLFPRVKVFWKKNWKEDIVRSCAKLSRWKLKAWELNVLS